MYLGGKNFDNIEAQHIYICSDLKNFGFGNSLEVLGCTHTIWTSGARFQSRTGEVKNLCLKNGLFWAIFEDLFLDFFTAKLFDKKSKKFHFHI